MYTLLNSTKLGIRECDYHDHSWGGTMSLKDVVKYQPKIMPLVLHSAPAFVDVGTNEIKNTLNELDPPKRQH